MPAWLARLLELHDGFRKWVLRRLRWLRSMRVRLALSFIVMFAVLLGMVGVLFRSVLQGIFARQVESLLEEEWGAMKGYMRMERVGGKFEIVWYADNEDPEEASIVARLQRVYLVADSQGRIVDQSEEYKALGEEPREEVLAVLKANRPAVKLRRGAEGKHYMVRSGVVFDENAQFYVSLGRETTDNDRVIDQFTLTYFALLPLIIVAVAFLGWILSGRALLPIGEVAAKAQEVSSSNLTLRVPMRGSGDELDHLVATFNRMVERLEASFHQIRQFSTDVSHELRTPLTVLRGELEVALMTAKDAEQYRDTIIDVLPDIDRLTRIVRALLQLSQAESGQLALQIAPVDLAALCREIVDEYQLPAEDSGITLEADTPSTLEFTADRVQIERLLMNLVDNAIKYTPSGGRISVRATAGEQIELVVADTGTGIPAEHLPHLFDRFYRVPSAEGNRQKGLGLGLSFVSWIVKAHGGTIRAECPPSGGTRFVATFPLPETGSEEKA